MKRNFFYRFAFLYLLTALGAVDNVWAQSDEAAVTRTLQAIFRGMELGDSAMVHKAFYPEVSMARVGRQKSGQLALERENGIQDWLKAIGTPHTETWYEEIWDVKVQIDGDFAQAWCSYAFYVGKRFSHCGVDAFQLIRQPDGWKVFHLADTYRTAPCNIPAEIQRKH